MSAIEKFTDAFAPYGLPANAIKPSYGMAEVTLSVASIAQDEAASAVFLDREQLGAGRAVTVAPDAPSAVAQVSCGRPIPDQWAVIAGPDGAEVPDGVVGEIWLYGDNVPAATSAVRKNPGAYSVTNCSPGSILAATPKAPRTTAAGWPPVTSVFTLAASST